MNSISKALAAECLGTFWLVLGGCGSAVLAAAFPGLGIGFTGVALAFGLTVFTGAYSFGTFSGGHFNPAVTIGLAVGRRFRWRDVPGYIVAQVIGGIIAAGVLFAIAQPDLTNAGIGAFATNGWSESLSSDTGLNPFGGTTVGMTSALITEIVMTFAFLFVIMGATDKRAPAGFAPIAIGLCLTLIHLISIPVTNTSVNPARSTAVAVFVGGMAVKQLWLFWSLRSSAACSAVSFTSSSPATAAAARKKANAAAKRKKPDSGSPAF